MATSEELRRMADQMDREAAQQATESEGVSVMIAHLDDFDGHLDDLDNFN